MYKTYISADKYLAKKAKMEEHEMSMGFVEDIEPVDLNYGFVPFNVSQKDKESDANLEAAHENNLERFGLNEAGC